MSFGAAISSCFRQYVGFSGRARRSEYWYFTLFGGIVYLLAAVIDNAVRGQVVSLSTSLALMLPSLAVSVRRLHDISRTGWWVLMGLVPLAGPIVLLVFACRDSHPFPNRYGPSPKPPQGGGPTAPYSPAGYGHPYGQQQWAPPAYGQQPWTPPAYGQQPWTPPNPHQDEPPAPNSWS